MWFLRQELLTNGHPEYVKQIFKLPPSNGYFIALVNRGGKEELLTFAGESFVTNPEGQIIARVPEGKDYILYIDPDLEFC